MKNIGYIFLFSFALFGCGEAPTEFTEEVLNDTFISLEGETTPFKDVLHKHLGKELVINVWASWCKDCILGLPNLKALQKEFPETQFVFLSVDRNEAIWKKSIARFGLKGDHYFIPDGQKGVFGDFLNSNWIPRYMVIDTQGNIKLFKAKKADDDQLKKALQ